MMISIIIPVYNAEKYLKKCVDSVVAALGKTSGEIILVENGSTDNSPEIAKKIAKENHKVSVLECHAPGAAAVRNYGAKKAKGDYLWFIDADDYIAKNAIDKLLSAANEHNADVVMMSVLRVYQDGSSSLLTAVNQKEDNYKSRFVRYGMGPWQVIVRRKWWIQNGFAFPEGIIHEDMALMSSLILSTNKYASVDEPLYYYCETPESVLHKTEFSPHVFDIFPALKHLYRRFETKNAEKEYHDELEWFFIWNLLIDAAKDFRKFKEAKSGFARSRELLKEYFPNWRRNRFLRQKPLRLQIRVRLNYHK